MRGSHHDPGSGMPEPEAGVPAAAARSAPEPTRSGSDTDAAPAADGGRASAGATGIAPEIAVKPKPAGVEAPDGVHAPGEPDEEPRLEEDLAVQAAKADEYLDLAKRTKADFENYKKRAAREMGLAEARGVTKLARELLPAVDNLDRALAAAQAAGAGTDSETTEGTLVSGIQLVHADVIAALARVGIEPFTPAGESFDPQHHEAVAQTPVDGVEAGTIVEVYQRGYRLGESILRPARVVVAG
jgi:molecular chaperone GrpE